MEMRGSRVQQARSFALEGAEVEVVGRQELVLCARAVQLAWVRRVEAVVPARETGGRGVSQLAVCGACGERYQ